MTDPLPARPGSPDAAARLRALLDAVPGLVAAVDGAGTIYEANAGRDPQLTFARLLDDPTRGADLKRALADVCNAARPGYEALLETGGGLWRVVVRPFAPGSTLEGAAVFVADLGDVLKARAALDASRYLDALGRIATNVSHEFNNILQVLSASLDGLSLSLPGPADREFLRIAEAAIDRGAKLALQLLTFSRVEPPHAEPFPVVAYVTEAWPRLESAAGAGRTLELIVRGAAQVLADRNHLGVALVNLLANARDATPPGGLITLEVSRVLESGSWYAALAVTDRGPGMTPEVLRRATEPFFTTKPQGTATGLGLATAKSVAEASGGQLRLRSRPGEGTTATLWLPVYALGVPQPPAAPTAPPESASLAKHVLIVDDEAAIAGWLRVVLRKLGCEARVAGSVAEAAAAFGDDPAWPDLVLLDMTLPDGTGTEIYAALHARRPELPFVVCSGYGDSDAIRHIVDDGYGRLTKPCSRADVEAAVNRALAAATA